LSRADALRIASDDRGLITGQTGSGKSTLANILLRDKRYLIVIDIKRNFILSRPHFIAETPEDITNTLKNYPMLPCIYRPVPPYSDAEEINLIFQWIYQRGNTFCYVDEMTAIIGRGAMSYPPFFRNLITQGRGLGIGMLLCTQRPSSLPLYVYSESSKFWKFFLLIKADQERMAQWMGEKVVEPKDFPAHSAHSTPYSFYYRDIHMRKLTAIEYSLSEETVKNVEKQSLEYDALAAEYSGQTD
jgi:hypothetical protein